MFCGAFRHAITVTFGNEYGLQSRKQKGIAGVCPPGRSAVAIVRSCGPRSITLVQELSRWSDRVGIFGVRLERLFRSVEGNTRSKELGWNYFLHCTEITIS